MLVFVVHPAVSRIVLLVLNLVHLERSSIKSTAAVDARSRNYRCTCGSLPTDPGKNVMNPTFAWRSWGAFHEIVAAVDRINALRSESIFSECSQCPQSSSQDPTSTCKCLQVHVHVPSGTCSTKFSSTGSKSACEHRYI